MKKHKWDDDKLNDWDDDKLNDNQAESIKSSLKKVQTKSTTTCKLNVPTIPIYKMIAKLSKNHKLSKKVTKAITKICKHAYCVGSQSTYDILFN
jgi:hypothetical protein